jgi:hypothetical protein
MTAGVAAASKRWHFLKKCTGITMVTRALSRVTLFALTGSINTLCRPNWKADGERTNAVVCIVQGQIINRQVDVPDA